MEDVSGDMKLNAEMMRVAPHFLLIGQFLGLAGSLGPSQVTFCLLISECTRAEGMREESAPSLDLWVSHLDLRRSVVKHGHDLYY